MTNHILLAVNAEVTRVIKELRENGRIELADVCHLEIFENKGAFAVQHTSRFCDSYGIVDSSPTFDSAVLKALGMYFATVAP